MDPAYIFMKFLMHAQRCEKLTELLSDKQVSKHRSGYDKKDTIFLDKS